VLPQVLSPASALAAQLSVARFERAASATASPAAAIGSSNYSNNAPPSPRPQQSTTPTLPRVGGSNNHSNNSTPQASPTHARTFSLRISSASSSPSAASASAAAAAAMAHHSPSSSRAAGAVIAVAAASSPRRRGFSLSQPYSPVRAQALPQARSPTAAGAASGVTVSTPPHARRGGGGAGAGGSPLHVPATLPASFHSRASSGGSPVLAAALAPLAASPLRKHASPAAAAIAAEGKSAAHAATL